MKHQRKQLISALTVKPLFPIFTAVLLFFILLNPLKSLAGEPDFTSVDRETYRLTIEQKWDSVIIVGKDALKHDIDYFYLRLRMGIAYYWMGKYQSAIAHLIKAQKFNSVDPLAAEYLCLSYIAMGKESDVRALSKKLPPMIKDKLQIGENLFETVHIESGYTFSSNQKLQENPNLMENDSIYGEQDLYGNHSYFGVDLSFYPLSKFKLTIAYNHLSFSKRKYFQYGTWDDVLDSTKNFDWGYWNYYSWNYKTVPNYFDYTVKQNEIYLGGVWQLPSRIKLMPSFHYINVKSPEITSSYTGKQVTDIIIYDTIIPDSSVNYTFEKPEYSYSQSNTTISNYVVSLGLSKDFTYFTPTLYGSFSNLNSRKQKQVGCSITWYPLRNANFYGYTNVFGLFEKGGSRLIFQQHLGGKLFHWLWLDGSAIVGDLTNANLSNGLIVYNNTDKINYRLGATANIYITKNLSLSIIYQYFSNESVQQYYSERINEQNESVYTVNTKYNNYQTHTIIGGITWKF